MKKIISLFSLIPAISYAHNDATHGVLASTLHTLTSPHHLLFAVVLVVVCFLIGKNLFDNQHK